MQTTSLKNKDSKILNKPTKIDAVTDGAISTGLQNPSLPLKEKEVKINIQSNCEKSIIYSGKRKDDETK